MRWSHTCSPASASRPRISTSIGRLRYLAWEYRAMAHRHPRFFPHAALHRLNMPAGVAFIERILRHFHATLGDDRLAAQTFRIFGYYVIGAALDETAGYAPGSSVACLRHGRLHRARVPAPRGVGALLQAGILPVDVQARPRDDAEGHRRCPRRFAGDRATGAETRCPAEGVISSGPSMRNSERGSVTGSISASSSAASRPAWPRGAGECAGLRWRLRRHRRRGDRHGRGRPPCGRAVRRCSAPGLVR